MDDKNSNFGVQSQLIKSPFYPRINHKVVRLNDQVLIFGGIGPGGQFLKTILRFNLENLKIDQISNATCPNSQGFSLFSYKGCVYLWGGCLENKFCNTLMCFRGTNISSVSQGGEIPPERGFHCSCLVAEKFLLVYGGFNETEIFNDWYILNLENYRWSKIQTNRQIPKNANYKLIWGNGKGYLVSQYQMKKSGSKILRVQNNQIYQLKMLSFSNFKLRLDLIEHFDSQPMPFRYNFSLALVQQQLWFVGGQLVSQKKNTVDQFSPTQVWALDLQRITWTKRTFMLNTRSFSELLGYRNKLFLIGGLRSISQMSSTVDVIQIKNLSPFQTQICNFCKSVFCLDSNTIFKKTNSAFQISVKEHSQLVQFAQISTNFISKFARTLQNPIQAIGILVQNSLNMGASTISLSIKTVKVNSLYFKDQLNYLYIGDNSKSFYSDEITKILFSFRYKVEKYYRDSIDKEDIKMRNQYGLNLKFGSLRLGNSCLFVTKTFQQSLFVCYFSDSETDCPDGESSFNCYCYLITDKGECSNSINRQIIRQNVKHFLAEDQFLNSTLHSTKTYIFNLSDITKADITNSGSDIVYSFPMGLLLTSLNQYLSTLYLTPFRGREIYIEQSKITFLNLISKFNDDEHCGWIRQIDTIGTTIFNKICLYRIIKENYYPNFVYVYHQNRLICTIGGKQRSICGYIQVPQPIQVDFFKSKIEKWQDERKLVGYIESKEEGRKRQRRIETLGEDERIRKMKQQNYLQF